MKARVTRLLVFFVFTVSAGCVGVGNSLKPDVQRANQEAFRGNATGAFAILRPLAEQGEVDAQYALAKIQLREKWKDRDPIDGKKWLLKAAGQGHLGAQFDLGHFYAVEEKNYLEALKWYRQVADQHIDDSLGRTAAENIGVMYASGQGVSRDYSEAASWFQKSAERGGPRGQFALGLIYFEGLAGPKDFGKAIQWLEAAAKQRYELAQYTLIFIHAEGFDTKPNALEAAYWSTGRRFSDKGEAAYHVGKFYSRGFSAWPDEQRVLAWLYKHRGVPIDSVQEYLKKIYGQRWADVDQAVRWYRVGAEAGFVGAQVNLAVIHWNPESRHWNCAEAVKWTRMAADKADPIAMVNLGRFYADGPREIVKNAIGVQMLDTENGIQAKSIVNGSPAEAAGIQPADIIVSVNDEDASKLGVRGIVDLIRTSKNREVVLRLRRGTDARLKTVRVTPREMHLKCPGADSAELKRDPGEATRWFKKASDRGNLSGLFFLAEAHRKGAGIPKDLKKALELFEKGADQGDWEAAQAISHMYASGEAGEVNKQLADEWFRKAIDLKHKSLGR